jgi:hypothetical protein
MLTTIFRRRFEYLTATIVQVLDEVQQSMSAASYVRSIFVTAKHNDEILGNVEHRDSGGVVVYHTDPGFLVLVTANTGDES